MFDDKGRLWLTAAVRGPDNPAFCKQGSDHPSAKLFPLKESHRQLAMLDPKTMKYTFVDTCFQTHHLQFGFDENDTLWTSGGGPVRRLAQHQDVRRDRRRRASRRAGRRSSSTPTATASATPMSSRTSRSIRTKDKRIAGGFYAIMPSPVDGSVWGTVGVFGGTGGDRAARSRQRSAGDRARRNLQRAAAGLRAARRRHRQQGRRLGLARQRPSRQLRPAQVQGPAQRAEGHRRPVPRRLDVLPVSRAPASPASARTAPRRATTPGSTSTTRSAWATTCRSRPATRTTRCSRS